jgi:hypothetical protein
LLTSGGRSVGIVRSRTQATEFFSHVAILKQLEKLDKFNCYKHVLSVMVLLNVESEYSELEIKLMMVKAITFFHRRPHFPLKTTFV